MVKVEFESPLPHKMNPLKPVPVAGFIFSPDNRAKAVPNVSHYRPPKLKKGKKSWYIEYYYRVPVNLSDAYEGKEWFRFRVKDDINRRTGNDRGEYADWLLQEISTSLKNGYNPFTGGIELVESAASGIEPKAELNITDALRLFLEKWKVRGLEPLSYSKYERYVTRLIDWLKLKHIPYADVTAITAEHIEQFLADMKRIHGFSNREYNNHFDFIRTAFNYLLKKKYITESPCAGIEKQKSKVTKHRYYDSDSLKKITAVLLAVDPYLYFACQVTYYACIRSDKELMNFKVGNINFEENKILLTADGAKGNRDRYIPMDENLKKIFIERGIDKADTSFFVFGIKGEPSSIPFGRGFFSKRFRKVRDLAGLAKVFTVYSFKFTRVVHLKNDGLEDSSIMALTGHSDFTAYARYLRNLGLEASPERINKVSRKV